jgi:hypothetical protein
MKICSICKIEKPLSNFSPKKLKSGNSSYASACKVCIGEKYRESARIRMAKRSQIPELRKKSAESVKKWKEANRDKVLEQHFRHQGKTSKRHGATRAEHKQQKALIIARNKLIRTLKVVANKKPDDKFCYIWNKPGMSDAWKWRTRYKLDNEFNLNIRIKSSIKRQIRKDRVGTLVRAAINSGGQSPKAEAALGYSIAELITHLERQFHKGMNWDEFKKGKIHIDHIIPLSSFDLTSMDEWKAAWSITNLMPLWAKDNIMKRDKIMSLL